MKFDPVSADCVDRGRLRIVSTIEQSAGGTTEQIKRWGIEGLSLGIALGGTGNVAEWSRAVEWVDFAEERALHSVWMPEMHFAPGGCSSPLLHLSAFSGRTRKLRLATTSLLLPLQHPLVIANEVAALDHLSQGRVILGLGRGFPKHLFDAFEIDPSTKRDRFDECLEWVLKIWSGAGTAEIPTRFSEMPGFADLTAIRPHQDPHPPLAVAAFGRKGLAQAARWGLPYLASPMEPFELIAENLAFHRENLRSTGDACRAIVPIMRTVFVSSEGATLARVRERLDSERRPLTRKLPAAIARALAAPLDERVVVGGPSDVIDHLARYREELGMNLLIVRPMIGGADPGAQEESMIRIVEEVVPALCS
jgi:alkanesulfonate monooxygenase SsuD/methylene tetrahydromethanopterin reductase-like flavin-dependent oxidoreductase (luciferase family)